jgi:hypothetical protein
VSFLPKQADLAPAYLEQCTKPDCRKFPDCKIHIPIQTLMPTPFHYLLSKYQNQRKQTTKTSSAKNHPRKPTGRKGDATTRPRKKTNTQRISHISFPLQPAFLLLSSQDPQILENQKRLQIPWNKILKKRQKERNKEKRKHKTRTSKGLRRLTRQAETASLKFDDAEEDTTPMPK